MFRNMKRTKQKFTLPDMFSTLFWNCYVFIFNFLHKDTSKCNEYIFVSKTIFVEDGVYCYYIHPSDRLKKKYTNFYQFVVNCQRISHVDSDIER